MLCKNLIIIYYIFIFYRLYMNYTFVFKYILLGDSGVGKSTYINQNINNEFNPSMGTTIGVDFLGKVLEINNDKIKIHIWDTAGQETFKCIVNSYYRDAIGVLVFYDVNNRQTFTNVEKWINELKSCNNLHKIAIIGNKIDMQKDRQISYEEGEELARRYDALFWEVSVKNNTNIQESLYDLTLNIANDIRNKKYSKETLKNTKSVRFENENSIDIIMNDNFDDKNKSKCCNI